MMAARRFLFIAAFGATLSPGAARAMIEPEVGRMSCALVLTDIATNPPNYQLYLTFVQGYLAARASANNPAASRLDDGAALTSVVDYCRSHGKENFAAALAAALKP